MIYLSLQKVFIFADDTTFQLANKSLEGLVKQYNNEINLASDWFCANTLALNAKKTKCIIYGPNNYSIPLPSPLLIDGTEIDRIGQVSWCFVGG